MNRLLDPISKLLRIENQNKLNDLDSKKEFLKNFKSFLQNSDDKSPFIDRFRLKKIKNDIQTKHISILENNKNFEYSKNYYLNNINESINHRNIYAIHSNKHLNNHNPNYFVVCSKNSKNIKNLKLYEDIKKQETINEFFESINIINTNTQANTTESIGVNTDLDFNLHEKNTKSNIDYINTKNSERMLKQTIKEIIKQEKNKKHKKIQRNSLKEMENIKITKNLNSDIENILTNESIVESIKNEKEKNSQHNLNNSLVREEISNYKFTKEENKLEAKIKFPIRQFKPKRPFNKINEKKNINNSNNDIISLHTNEHKSENNNIKKQIRGVYYDRNYSSSSSKNGRNQKERNELESNQSNNIIKGAKKDKREKIIKDVQSNYDFMKLQTDLNNNLQKSQLLEHDDLFLPNIMQQRERCRQKLGTKIGNVKNLSESFINNFKVKSKERMKKRHHTNFFLNLNPKQF